LIVLIRFISTGVAGAIETSDKIVRTDVITIGRATDQVLHIKDKRARLKHAEIRQVDGEFRISTAALAGVTVNGRSQREIVLAAGDVIEVGANQLRVIEPGADADFALSFELVAGARDEDVAPDWTRTPAGIAGVDKRRLAWIAVAVVAAFSLLLPAASLLHPSVAALMRGSVLLPDDGLWLSGPVHSAHSSISSNCESCHTNLFRRVADTACTECHAAGRHVSGPSYAVLGEVRCASCHREHNEPPQLVNRSQGLCADCHNDLPADVPLQPAGDFLDAHPGFRVSLLMPTRPADGATDWNVEHVRLADSRTAERSNLKFDHKVHLDPGGVTAPGGRQVLSCSDCHQPEPGGARMVPIAMDEHCSGCHALNFDADAPDRAVPHGDPEGVVQALVEFYSARLLGEDTGSSGPRVRRPGQALTRADRDRVAAEARVQALAVAADLFERRACVNCHTVTATGGGDMPWRVEPVRLTGSFFPHANFSHAAHATEVTRCDGCHEASLSESAADLLIPGIDNCRECHGSGVARRNRDSQIPSTCVMCHDFHFAAKGEYP